jgi:UPF0271 protein
MALLRRLGRGSQLRLEAMHFPRPPSALSGTFCHSEPEQGFERAAMPRLDLNCDLGEGEPPARTRALMRWITSANVACGGHAGSAASMALCVRLAKRWGVRLGAHPGLCSRADFGRGRTRLSPDELELLLLHQVSALERMARAEGVRLHHIKLHGGLYHATEEDSALAARFLKVAARWWPNAKVYARAGGRVAQLARRAGVPVWEEAFADRAYRDDGTLAPRGEPGAVLTDARTVIARAWTLLEQGEVQAQSGRTLRVRAQTLCLHSDTPGATTLARALARTLRLHGSRRHSLKLPG